jgi:hypothetical protein
MQFLLAILATKQYCYKFTTKLTQLKVASSPPKIPIKMPLINEKFSHSTLVTPIKFRRLQRLTTLKIFLL